ncbi:MULTISPECIES: hypothetical protein [unclassified Kitasatospora]|uniref:hypothetical protein n=1 Tax=unclassified Kitasatospora TaxID=2633591 RepID=UPI000708B2DC|nr:MULTISPECIES: hypothetical protein [unclassified Kitasatospora]KQV20920.1 hypothetical protein ASC99_20670 [Kitasatospora sp. Root107]KRB60426.1 hypothetical protein ASE03_12510 [Kitasatospora sp. Root187]
MAVTQPDPPAPARPTADPTRVGTALVLRALGVERLTATPGWHDEDDTPLGRLTSEVHRTARRLDHVQQNLVALASSIRRDMQRVIDGADVDLPQTHGVLGSTAQSLDLLVARRAELHQHLEALTELHKVLTSAASSPPPAAEAESKARTNSPPRREAKLSDPQKQVLDAVALGTVTVRETSIRQGTKISAGGQRLSPASVNSLIERKLIVRDTSTNLYFGQKLRLTDAGARLRASLAGTSPARTPLPISLPGNAGPTPPVSVHPPRTTPGAR